jgi:hypothetical protein
MGMSTPSAEIEMVKIGQARNTLMNMRLTQVTMGLVENAKQENTDVSTIPFLDQEEPLIHLSLRMPLTNQFPFYRLPTVLLVKRSSILLVI